MMQKGKCTIPPGRTLCRYLLELAQSQPDKKLAGDEEGWVSASKLMQESFSVCEALKSFGIRSGDIVALKARRNVQTIAALFGIRMAGAAVLLTGPYGEPEEILRDCETQIPAVCRISADAEGVLLRSGTDRSCRILPGSRTWFPLPVLPEDAGQPGFIIFTSGSTGKSKAVTLSDRNLIANLLDSAPLGDYREDDIALGILPLEHVFGLVLAAGMAVLHYAVFLPQRKDVRSILSVIERERITRMNGVPSLYQAMAEAADSCDLRSLRAGFIGGAPFTVEQFRHMESALGMTLIPVYGMSECIGISCSDFREKTESRCGTVGKIYPWNTVQIIGEQENVLPAGQIGEIRVNGPARMLGYWPDRMEPEEFLRTGDLGYLTEDGHLVLTGRKKDIIIRNGKNISPVRIENALLSLAGVRAAAVVSLPDEQQGEVPYAMAVSDADPADLRDELILRNLLPKNELPAGILCVQSLPLTPSGKPDKESIRGLLLEQFKKIT